MLCIHNPHTDVYFNLAAEEYLLKNFTDDIFMIWQNESAAVIGKYQHVQDEINIEYATQNNVKIARRITGGGTVYHDLGNLNITFIEQNGSGDAKAFTNRLLTALQPLIPGIHSDERNNLLIKGLKISGSAQCIHQNRFMHHCTLLFSANIDFLDIILHTETNMYSKKSIKTVQSIHSPVTNILKHTLKNFSISEFENELLTYIYNQNPQTRYYNFSTEDMDAIIQLREEKYISSNWIYKW